MNFPVIDLHCDTVLALLGDDMNQAGSLRKNRFHIDLERASRLGGYAQCFACFTTPFMEKRHHVSPVVAFERDNRGISKDSRYPDVGQIDKREVLGKAIFLMYPGTDEGTYPREFDRVGAIQ